MRLQLAVPENTVAWSGRYNQTFTMHGRTMMFLFAVPVMEGMGVYLVPLMLGTRNVAFPKLNAFGYWMYLAAGLFLYIGLLLNIAPDAGWFAYPPLPAPNPRPAKAWTLGANDHVHRDFRDGVAVEMIVTVLRMRAPGMSLNRMPLFCWSMLVQSFMIIFAMPAVMVASTVLLLDGPHHRDPFIQSGRRRRPLLYQHIFWFFGHPEVYIIFLPALGMVSAISRPHPAAGVRLSGNGAVADRNGFIAFGLWVHHMFATGLPQIGESFFTAASMMIAVPTGVQIFGWLATSVGRRASAHHDGDALRVRLHFHLHHGRHDGSDACLRCRSIFRSTTHSS